MTRRNTMLSNIKPIMIIIILLVAIKLEAKEFYEYLGQSESNLTIQLGPADLYKEVGTVKVYKYYTGASESLTFSVKAGKVFMAIKSINTNSLEKAKKLTSIQILYYMSMGFVKKGSEEGMTILKKGKRVLSIGWMGAADESYSTIVSAL